LVKRENLIRPMITGDKSLATKPPLEVEIDSFCQRMLALAVFLLISLGLYFLIA